MLKHTLLSAAVMTLAISTLACGGSDEPIGEGTANVTDAEGGNDYPIILAHGFDASPTNRWGWNGVKKHLEERGFTVYEAIVPPYASVADRAWALADHVDEAYAEGHDKVHILAHSMGGLDSRYVVSQWGYGDIVRSVTTISTPHQGSGVADAMVKALDGLKVDTDLINALASAWGLTYSEMAGNSNVRAALVDISEAAAPKFNEANPDDERVYYQSWAGVSSIAGIKNPKDRPACEQNIVGDYRKADRMNVTLKPMAAFVAHGLKFYPNDGMVRVESAKWGKFHGCIPADHLDEVGYNLDEPNKRTGWDHRSFYLEVAGGLAELSK